MNTRNTTQTAILIQAAAMIVGALAFTGCQSTNESKAEEPAPPPPSFFPGQTDRPPQNIALAQAKKGARNDGMLQPYHFDGDHLNSLGEAKLDRMISDDPNAMTTIYLNFSESEMLNQRRDDVVAYLRDSGVEESRLTFVSGPNPATLTPAAAGLARINRTENAQMQIESDEGNASTGGFGASPSGGSNQ